VSKFIVLKIGSMNILHQNVIDG